MHQRSTWTLPLARKTRGVLCLSELYSTIWIITLSENSIAKAKPKAASVDVGFLAVKMLHESAERASLSSAASACALMRSCADVLVVQGSNIYFVCSPQRATRRNKNIDFRQQRADRHEGIARHVSLAGNTWSIPMVDFNMAKLSSQAWTVRRHRQRLAAS